MPAAPAPRKTISFAPVEKSKRGQRIVLFGTGGIGKTTLACLAPGKTAFVDAEESLETLKAQLEEIGATLPVVVPATDWDSTRSALQADESSWAKINNIVIDTATKLEEWCVAYTLKTVRVDGNKAAHSIEDYGYGKGYQFVFDKFLPILQDLDRHVRAGRNVILIAHDCVCNVPNPGGADWIRYEPRLQSPTSGKASIRLRLKEWADHVLFFGYDVNVTKDGKAEGSGTRTLYTREMPSFMAKSRTTSDSFSIEYGASPWESILK